MNERKRLSFIKWPNLEIPEKICFMCQFSTELVLAQGWCGNLICVQAVCKACAVDWLQYITGIRSSEALRCGCGTLVPQDTVKRFLE
jgi:hypothetical protein